MAFGFLRTSAFSETDEDCFQRCFLRNSYENEIQIFVQQLVEGIHMELDKDGMISAYTFECEQDFDTKRLLWACMDLLIKADLTISEIKKERMKLLHRVAPSEI